jgi:hypothetical protein
VDDLLLARIEARRIYVLGRRDLELGDLPEAGVLQKTDLIHGAQTGVILGAALGVLGGAHFMIFPPSDFSLPLATILIGSLLGALFGFCEHRGRRRAQLAVEAVSRSGSSGACFCLWSMPPSARRRT